MIDTFRSFSFIITTIFFFNNPRKKKQYGYTLLIL